MRILVLALTLLLALLNYYLWLSEDRGLQKVRLLREAIATQRTDNAALDERNKTLEAEVKDLKGGLAAIEERARLEMGMIRQDETFFHILEGKDLPKAPAAGAPKATAKPKPTGQEQQPADARRAAPAGVKTPPARKPAAVTETVAKAPVKPVAKASLKPAATAQPVQPAPRKSTLAGAPPAPRPKPHD